MSCGPMSPTIVYFEKMSVCDIGKTSVYCLLLFYEDTYNTFQIVPSNINFNPELMDQYWYILKGIYSYTLRQIPL